MEKFFSPINSGSSKERREKARVFKNAIQEGFDAIDDANELRSGKEEIRRMEKRHKLAMHRKLRQLDEMQKAQAVVQNRASLLKKREREDQQHLQAQFRVQNAAAGVGIIIAESGDDEPYQVKKTKQCAVSDQTIGTKLLNTMSNYSEVILPGRLRSLEPCSSTAACTIAN